jgi:oxygen-independent coproporphyrinogen-3 oxidase
VQHVYVHVPFCRRRCSYCDFSIAVRRHVPAAGYVAAVRTELAQLRRAGVVDDRPLETVYFGGGTPSLLEPDALRTLLRDIVASTPRLDAVEVTLEANPEDVTPARAAAWRAAGVNRVSLGAQSFDDGVLAWMHRPHDAARIGAAAAALRTAGMANVSLDLIFALPPALERDWDRDLDRTLALEPAHVSLYGLTVEARTPLARWIARGAVRPTDDERYATEYLRAAERLGAAGYEFYEVSNAARPGRRSLHNSAYWTARSYVGLGPAAHSFDGRARRWNVAPWAAYQRALAEGRSPLAHEEVLTDEQRRLEALYLGLRTEAGVPATVGPPDRLTTWLAAGWVRRVGERLVCTAEGWLRLDALIGDLTGHPATSQIITTKEVA